MKLFGRISLTLMKANALMLSTRCQDADFPPPLIDGIEWMYHVMFPVHDDHPIYFLGNKCFHTLSKRCNQLQLLPSTAQGRCNFSKCNLYLSCSACATRNICTFTFHHFFSKEETSAASSSFFLFLFKSKLFLLITCTVWSAQCTGLFYTFQIELHKNKQTTHIIWFDLTKCIKPSASLNPKVSTKLT